MRRILSQDFQGALNDLRRPALTLGLIELIKTTGL